MPTSLSLASNEYAAVRSAPARLDGSMALGAHLRALRAFGARQHYAKNETVFAEGDEARFVYKILGGTIRLCRHRCDGRRHIVDFALAGDLVGFIDAAQHPLTAEAVSDVTAIAYPRAQIDRLRAANPDIAAQMSSLLSSNLVATQDQLVVLGCQNAKERFASFLVRMAQRLDVLAGDRLDLCMSRQDIADHLGLTIETVCRTIAALKAGNVIAVPNSHQLILRNPAALAALADGSEAP